MIPVTAEVRIIVYFEIFFTVQIKDQTVLPCTGEVSLEMINSSAIIEVRVFVESGNLVSGIRDFSLSILLEKVELANNGAVLKLMFKGRRSQVAE